MLKVGYFLKAILLASMDSGEMVNDGQSLIFCVL